MGSFTHWFVSISPQAVVQGVVGYPINSYEIIQMRAYGDFAKDQPWMAFPSSITNKQHSTIC